MLICICKGVADRQIQATIRDGARSVEEVSGACGAGTDCGSCLVSIEKMLRHDTQSEASESDGQR